MEGVAHETKLVLEEFSSQEMNIGTLMMTGGASRSRVWSEIVGYITRGRGVSIHRTDCVNVLCMDEFDRKRLIEAEWSEDLLQNQKMYMTEINIYANDSKGLVFSLSKIFNEENINLTGMNVRVNKQGKATVSVKFEIRSKEQLNKLIAKIRNVEGIIDIERTTG